MRKSFLLAAAGAGLLLTGCQDSIVGGHNYQTIPVDEIPYDTPAARPVHKPVKISPTTADIPPAKEPAAVRKYVPMTGVTSSGGVDSVVRKTKKIKRDAAAPVAKGGVHVIKRGETPGLIAKRYKVRLSDLMSANNLTEESAKKLQVGQKLTIPGSSSVKVENGGKSKKHESTATVEKGKYRVRRGDSPEKIAKRVGVKLDVLLKANNLDEKSSRSLQIGQILIIPDKNGRVIADQGDKKDVIVQSDVKKVDKKEKQLDTKIVVPKPIDNDTTDSIGQDEDVYEVPADMTIAELAKKIGCTEAKLRYLNPGLTDDNIAKETVVVVPKIK